MEQIPQQPQQTLLTIPLQKFLNHDPDLRLNRLEKIVILKNVSSTNSTNSVTQRRPDGTSVFIGAKQTSPQLVNKWNMGTHDVNEQIFIKTAHELAHVFQEQAGYESALCRFLNEEKITNKDAVPYIQLYLVLLGTGPVNALSDEPIYKEQSRHSGRLKIEVLEDITELISAYLISDEYFTFRLDGSVAVLEDDVKEFIALKIVEICKVLDM